MAHSIFRIGNAPYLDDGYFFVASKPADKLLVFVHGFGGGTGTWGGFPRYLNASAAFETVDILFYNYNSLFRSAATTGAKLRTTIATFWDVKAALATRTVKYGSPRAQEAKELRRSVAGVRQTRKRILERLLQPASRSGYERIILACHSLGGVVARVALLHEGIAGGRTWLPNTRLVLFAPAHAGSPLPRQVDGLASRVLDGLPWSLVKLGLRGFGKSPTHEDLETSSPLLRHLHAEHERLDRRRKFPGTCVSLIYGEHESVVHPLGFVKDPAPRVLPGHDHFSICKPSGRFMTPVEAIVDALS